MREKNPDMVAGEKRKFVMKPPQVVRVGTKKTSFVNFTDICKLWVKQTLPFLDWVCPLNNWKVNNLPISMVLNPPILFFFCQVASTAKTSFGFFVGWVGYKVSLLYIIIIGSSHYYRIATFNGLKVLFWELLNKWFSKLLFSIKSAFHDNLQVFST